MEYDIKLSGTHHDNGAIDIDKLALLAEHVHDIAKGALQMHLLGTSSQRGRDSKLLDEALRIRLTGLSHGSTVLTFECQPFKETVQSIQGNMFRQEILHRLSDETPMSIVMDTLQNALSEKAINEELIDLQLLKNVQRFKQVFINPVQQLEISNRGSREVISFKRLDLDRVKAIEQKIPSPRTMVIVGLVEELKFSKGKVTIVPDQGMRVTGFLTEDVLPQQMAPFWGKRVGISGKAVYKQSGNIAHIEISHVWEAGDQDTYFSKHQKKQTNLQKFKETDASKNSLKALRNISGVFADMPGTIEDDLKFLKS
jgi:hypothetical protein